MAVALGVAAILGATSSCSSTAVVSPDEAAQQISDALESQVGQRPDKVECPDELDAEVGEEMRCELSAGEQRYAVTIRITDVTDGVAAFDIVVDDEPT